MRPPPLLRFCLDRGYQLRFIEQMPLDAQHGWRRADMVTADEILAALSAEFSLTPRRFRRAGISARRDLPLVDGGPDRRRHHRVGHQAVLRGMRPGPAAPPTARSATACSPTTRATCALLLRAGADDDQLAAIWRRAVAAKLPGHGINDHGFLQPTRPMSAIGG